MSLSPINSNWRNDMQEYFRLVDHGLAELIADAVHMGNLEKIYPYADIKKSLEKSVLSYWRTEFRWQDRKRDAAHSKTGRIDMKRTLYDTVQYNLVEKSPFAPKPNETRDAKPVVEEAEERRNIHLQQLAADIGTALMRIPESKKIRDEYIMGFNEALEEGKDESFLEEFYKRLQTDYPGAFVKTKDKEELFQEAAQSCLVNGDKNRETARRILTQKGV